MGLTQERAFGRHFGIQMMVQVDKTLQIFPFFRIDLNTKSLPQNLVILKRSLIISKIPETAQSN